MKNLMAKIKGFDYKGFFLRHGEKIGMATAGLIVLACLAITNWSGYSGTPEQLKEKATNVESQLRANKWPETKQAEFIPITAEREVARLTTPIELAAYDFAVPMSPKLYSYRLPADEPEIAVVTELFARPGVMAMELQGPPPEAEESAEEDEDEPAPRAAASTKSRKSDKKSVKDGLAAAMMPMMGEGEEGMSSMMMMGGVGTTTGKARGVRYVVVTGAVDRRKRLELLQKALHLETVAQAADYLEYLDFKVQRQRAVPGADPWAGEWRDLNTSFTMEVLLNESAQFDPDLVAAEYMNDVFTSPLPHRLDGDWEFDLVGHPRVPALDEEGREAELAINKAALEVVTEAGEGEGEEGQKRGGFRRVQRDANALRSRALSVGGEGGAAGGEKMAAAMARMMGGMGGMGMGAGMGGMVPGGGQKGSGDSRTMMGSKNMQQMMMAGMTGGSNMMGSGMGSGMGMGMYGPSGMMGGAGTANLAAKILLFRYFDFEVEPGECYRYRVQLVIRNPSHEEAFVSTPEVASGETRESTWSSASTPAVVQNDIDYALVKVYRRGGHREGAELSVVQFDTDVGTLVAGNLKVPFGSYVGKTQKSELLNLAVPSLEDADVTFSSKEVLVDSISAPALSESTVLGDLKLDSKQFRKLIDGGLDQAATVNRFGEIVSLDADSVATIQPAKKRYNEQMEAYKDLKETGESSEGGGLESSAFFPGMEGMMGDGGKGRKKRGKGGNPLKMPGSMGMGMGMMPPPGMGGGFDPTGGTKGKKKTGSKR